ncbi:hypothetical protein D3C75_1116920 [compost metagenome]
MPLCRRQPLALKRRKPLRRKAGRLPYLQRSSNTGKRRKIRWRPSCQDMLKAARLHNEGGQAFDGGKNADRFFRLFRKKRDGTHPSGGHAGSPETEAGGNLALSGRIQGAGSAGSDEKPSWGDDYLPGD